MPHPPTLLAITPGDGRDLLPWLRALGTAGLEAVLLREPSMAAADYVALARASRGLVPRVILHARQPAWRQAIEADQLLHDPTGPGPGRSSSCHSPEEVDQALAAGAEFVLWSPVHAPTSKPDDPRPTIGSATFLAHAAHRPVLALGGIDPARHARLMAGGAAGSAVLGDLFGRRSPADAAARLRDYCALVSSSPKTNSSS